MNKELYEINKELYQMLNGAHIDLSLYKEKPMGAEERRQLQRRLRLRRQPRTRRIRYAALIGVFAVALGMGTGLLPMERVVTAAMPLLAKLPGFGQLMEAYLHVPETVLHEFKTTVGETVTDEGVSIRLDEVLLDDGRLVVTTTAASESLALAPKPLWPDAIYIDGEQIYTPGGGGDFYETPEGAMSSITTLDLGTYEPRGELELTVVYRRLSAADGTAIHGEWAFTIASSAEQLAAATTTVPIGHRIELGDGLFEIDSLTLTPLSVKVNYRHLGGSTYDIRFEVADQDGQPLQILGGTSMAEHSHHRYALPDASATRLVFTPLLFSGEEGAAKTDVRIPLPEQRFEVELPQATGGAGR